MVRRRGGSMVRRRGGSMEEERLLNVRRRGGSIRKEVAQWLGGEVAQLEERWFDRGEVASLRRGGPMVVHPIVLGSNPAAPQPMANSVRL
jgi:hypothetical protein